MTAIYQILKIMKNDIYCVRTCFWKTNIQIETDDENAYSEACKKSIERLLKSDMKFEIGPVLLCKKSTEKYEKVLNAFKILEEIGLHSHANDVRNQFLEELNIDLSSVKKMSTL
jgi:hypothetical protein